MRALTIGTIAGIPVRIHWSFLIALPLLALVFGQNVAPAAELVGADPRELAGSLWLWGLALTLALFLSVLVHELAHAIYARRKGAAVHDITLLMIGGVSRIGDPPRARHEAIMALAGPGTSLALGVAAGLVFTALPAGWLEARVALVLLAEMNLLLGLFNLVPAFPMDGGRVLRAVLSARLGPLRATRAASLVGKAFAIAFVLAGVLGGGVFLVLIGGFVYLGAEAEARQVRMKSALGRVRVRDLMSGPIATIGAHDSVRDAAERMMREHRTAYPVVDPDDGQVIGVLTLGDVRKVPDERRARVEAAAVAHRAPPVAPDDEAWTAFRAIVESDVPVLPVVDHGELVGAIDQSAIMRGVELGGLAAPR
jgi:Zn-dependent protease/predicted transcriptional regulator